MTPRVPEMNAMITVAEDMIEDAAPHDFAAAARLLPLTGERPAIGVATELAIVYEHLAKASRKAAWRRSYAAFCIHGFY